MPTIAELQLLVDSREVISSKDALDQFRDSASKAKQAADGFSSGTSGNGGLAPEKETKKVKDLSEVIDAQTRKLKTLGEQRKALESSGMKSTMPGEYERLNRIIDANITKVQMQGNAVEQVANRQDRDAKRKQAAAETELRIQERAAQAAVRQENIVSAASARQQRSIEATINGLSRQVKAQNEYNRTIEKLNEARATSGMSGPDSNTMSAGEYDSYVKLAQAKRDAALATQDNTREMEQAQAKLDTYTATLGKVERAQVEYARATSVVSQAQKLGLLTTDEYNQKMQLFADKRDAAVAAANDNSRAEERFERQLRQVMGAYDPVVRAQDQYNAAIKILSTGLQNGSVSVDQFNKALTEQRIALDEAKGAAQNSAMKQIASDYDDALNKLIPYRTELSNLAQQQKVLDQARASGQVQTAQQIKDYDAASAAIARQTEEYKRRIKSANENVLTAKAEAAAMRGLPAQFTDIVVSLQGGQAPLTVLLQQGGQIKDMFGGAGAALKAMGSYVIGLINPFTVLAAVVGTLGIAAYQGQNELLAFNKAMIQSRNASGVSASQFSQFRQELDDISGTSAKAADAIAQMAKGGEIAGDLFVTVGEAAVKMSKATGESMEDIINDFNSLGKDPVKAAVTLDEKYRFLTASILAQADALVDAGKETEATTLLQTALAEQASKTADDMIEQAGYIEKAWAAVSGTIKDAWDALKNVGRDATTADRIRELEEENANIIKVKGSYAASKDSRVQANEAEIRILRQRMTFEADVAKQRAADEESRKEAARAERDSQKAAERNLKGVAKAEKELADRIKERTTIQADAARQGTTLTPEHLKRLDDNVTAAEKAVTAAKEKAGKKRPGALDTTDVQDVKSNTDLIMKEYEGYYKKIQSLGDANIVSQEATAASQRAILDAQRKAVSSSYDAQIEALNKLRENKKNSAAQNISIDNQLTKAETAKAKAMEDIDTKMEVLHNKEIGRLKERERNIAAYKDALENQLQGARDEGARAVDGVGRGDREAALSRQLADNDRSFARQQNALSKSLAEGMDPTEYAEKLKALKETHTDMTNQIIANDQASKEATQDWYNGFTRAVENAQEAGYNFAGTVDSMLTGAFNSAGDALATFVTTGKINFKSFAASVVADMATIAAKQAAMGALGALFNIGMTAAGAYFGGGAGAAAGGTASSGFGQLGGSYQTPTVFQAQGGAWSAGKQYFAQGGAFTNSVVSGSTEFGMGNGRRGVMGEAGPEAIVPLARTRDGNLGVRMLDGMKGGGNATVVNVSVQVTNGQSQVSSDNSAYQQFGDQLGNFVTQEVYKIINKEQRPGGSLEASGSR